MAEPTEPFVYEDAVHRIESIIEKIESGDAGLDETIAQCEQGLKLITRCREVLNTAERRIAELLADESGDLTIAEEDDREE